MKQNPSSDGLPWDGAGCMMLVALVHPLSITRAPSREDGDSTVPNHTTGEPEADPHRGPPDSFIQQAACWANTPRMRAGRFNHYLLLWLMRDRTTGLKGIAEEINPIPSACFTNKETEAQGSWVTKPVPRRPRSSLPTQ